MISIEHGIEIVMSVAKVKNHRTPAEHVPLQRAFGRVLREDVVCDSDSPAFDKSIRDGFAVRARDVKKVPVVLSVTGESRAGAASDVMVGAGQCCEIMTGAQLPDGADAVVMVENTERVSPDSVRILKSPKENDGLLRRGVEALKGEKILDAGNFIGLADIGLLAGVGKSNVAVSWKPRVAILATGDELIEAHEIPEAGQIRNSNSYTLHSQVLRAGGEPILMGVGRDDLFDLHQKMRRGLKSDIFLVSGGVSMGKYDLVESAFAEFGIQIMFDQVAMKPGKPTVFGHHENGFVFGLPGNPVSTIVAFEMFVRPLILFLLGANMTRPEPLVATLEAPAKCDPQRAALVPARVRFEGGSYLIATAAWKGSSDLVGLARANALIMIPQRDGTMEAGESAQFLFLE